MREERRRKKKQKTHYPYSYNTLFTHPDTENPPHRAFLIEALIHPCFCILSMASTVIDGPGPMTITSNLPCGLAILSAMLSARPHASRVKSAGEARSFRSRYSSSDLKQKRRTPSVRRRCVAVSSNKTV